jgi:hypothetical protein
LVPLITGNFDDSQSSGAVWVVAGYAGYANQWDHFETLWNAALKKHDVPYFHMREMAEPDGAFKKWLPPEEHQSEVAVFFVDLADAIRRSGLRIVSSAVWLRDLNLFNQENGLKLEAYPLAAYSCWVQIAQHYDQSATTVFDNVEKIDDKLRKARIIADSDIRCYPGSVCDQIAAVPLQKRLTTRDVPAMQAADFVAWEIRKALFKMKPWVETSDRPVDNRKAG